MHDAESTVDIAGWSSGIDEIVVDGPGRAGVGTVTGVIEGLDHDESCIGEHITHATRALEWSSWVSRAADDQEGCGTRPLDVRWRSRLDRPVSAEQQFVQNTGSKTR